MGVRGSVAEGRCGRGGRLLTFGGWRVSLEGETGMMPTGTTPSEFMLLVCLTVGCAVMDYVLRLAGWMRESQAASFWEWSTRHRPERKLKGVEALGAVRAFYRSPVAFLFVGLPLFASCCGTIVMSLLRDPGGGFIRGRSRSIIVCCRGFGKDGPGG